jgi:hypothetical protein
MDMIDNLALGAMLFGTVSDERRSFEILDRCVDAGGVWIDTANCYAFGEDPSGFGPPGPAGRRYPQQDRTDVRHHTRTVHGHPQIPRPRRKPHLGGASLAEKPCSCRNHKFPLQERHFRLSTR